MKYFVVTASLITGLLFNQVKSNAQAFLNGDNVLGVGVGVGSALGAFDYGAQTPSVSVNFEHGQWNIPGPGVVSLGGYLGFKSYSDVRDPFYGYHYTRRWNYFVIGVRGAYHYNGLKVKNLDVYGGVMAAFNIVSYSTSSNDPRYDYLYDDRYPSYPSVTPFVGGRYFFTDRISAYSELSYGVSLLTVGLAFKL